MTVGAARPPCNQWSDPVSQALASDSLSRLSTAYASARGRPSWPQMRPETSSSPIYAWPADPERCDAASHVQMPASAVRATRIEAAESPVRKRPAVQFNIRRIGRLANYKEVIL